MTGPPTNISEQLRRDEGDKRRVYFINQIPHFGIGHNGLNGPPLSDAAVAQILRDDLAVFEADLDRLIPWWRGLSDARQGVLLNMAFNLGAETLVEKNPRMLACLKAGNWDGSIREMLDGRWAAQVGPRAYRLAQQVKTDAWQ